MQMLVLKTLVSAHNFINKKVVRDRVCSKEAKWLLCSPEKASQGWGQEKKSLDWKWVCQLQREKVSRIRDQCSASLEEKLRLHFLIKQKRYYSPHWTNTSLLNSSRSCFKSTSSFLPSSSKSITSYHWSVKPQEKFVGRTQKTEKRKRMTNWTFHSQEPVNMCL